MLNIIVENIGEGELAVVTCAGRMTETEAAHKLHEAVTLQTDARIVVVELSEVSAIGRRGFGMLVILQRWARRHGIRFLLFDPSKSVRGALEGAKSIAEFYIPSLEEMMALLAYANCHYALAA